MHPYGFARKPFEATCAKGMWITFRLCGFFSFRSRRGGSSRPRKLSPVPPGGAILPPGLPLRSSPEDPIMGGNNIRLRSGGGVDAFFFWTKNPARRPLLAKGRNAPMDRAAALRKKDLSSFLSSLPCRPFFSRRPNLRPGGRRPSLTDLAWTPHRHEGKRPSRQHRLRGMPPDQRGRDALGGDPPDCRPDGHLHLS